MKFLKELWWMILGGWGMGFMVLLGGGLGSVPGAKIAFWIVMAAIAILYITCATLNFRSSRRKEAPISERHKRDLEEETRVRGDPEAEERVVERRYRGVWAAWTALLLLELASGILAGMAYGAPSMGYLCHSTFMGMWMLGGLLRFALARPQLFPESGELSREDFPLLFETIDEVRKTVGATRPVRVYRGAWNVGVSQRGKWDYIEVEPLYLKLLTRDEFRQVMLHECDHLASPELAKERKWVALTRRQDMVQEANILVALSLLPLSAPMVRFREKMEMYTLLISETLERRADQRILTDGCPSQAVAGIAKAAMYEKYKDEDTESSFFMAGEDGIKVNEVRERVMRKMMAEMGETWRAEIERTLPAHFNSHPTFAQRKAALGVEEYDPFQVETDERWIREMDALCAMEDQDFAKNEDFVQWATNVAKERRQDIDAYERASRPLKELDPRALLDAALAYDGIDTPRSLEILGKLCEREPNNGEALLHYGRILLRMRNDAGYDFLYRAAEKPNYTGDAMGILREKVYESGDRERIRQFEEHEDALLQDAQDFHEDMGTIQIRDLKPATMPAERMDPLISQMKEMSMGSLAAIDCAAKTRADEDGHVFVLKFCENVGEDRQKKVYQMIFEMLDQRPESYALLTEEDLSMSKLEAHVPGCRVYTKE